MKALIIGAGPAGLVTALRLKQALGVEPVVYEIRSEPTTLGGAVQLPPNGLRLIEQLGLSKAVLARGFSSARLQLHSMQGRVLADWDRTDGTRKATDHGFLRILRNDLLHVLLEAVQDHGITIHYSKSLTRVDETDANIAITFSDESTDSGDIMLGCDGIHSAVRSLLIDPEAKPEYSGIANMFGLLSVSVQEMGIDPALHATITPHGLVAMSPYTTAADRLYWFFSRSVPIPESGNRDGWEAVSKHEVDGFKQTLLDVLADATGEWNGKLRKIISNTDRVKFYPIYKMPPNCKWFSKRSLLLGDAAHAMQPHIGQGTSMALEDAFYLSRVLEDPGRSLTEAFQIYETVRRPRVERIAQASADRGDTRQVTGPAWHRLKEIGIGLGFWIYKTARLDKMGVGMDKEAVEYDIMQEPIPRLV
jgi:2-polyprenyl-6-methoxyphenol hydroxylase-like FAD-dependent oxidoreductase